ncbi:MAG: 4-hydroxy-tetrahydrodipicolinate reductase [Saprospiraceae bacterium]|nr:4-hydroxy-tetrahydrodipicolinate reductase [Saprospiraceae bacterium]
MNICLIGYGKMGKAIEDQALKRGHSISAILRSDNQNQISDYLEASDIAIEFTQPDSALENIAICFEHNTPVVCGTTGWTHHWDELLHFQKQTNGSLVWASNFSVGVNILFQINQQLAKIMNLQSSYEVELEEIHHIHKKDAPSGTALSLSQQILDQIDRYTNWHLKTEPFKEKSIPIHAIRQENVVGYHEVKYKSLIDEIKISHNAFTREGFALGAVLAAEWLSSEKAGIFTMADVLGFKEQ